MSYIDTFGSLGDDLFSTIDPDPVPVPQPEPDDETQRT